MHWLGSFASIRSPKPAILPAQRHIDIAGKTFDGIAAMDDSFFDALAKLVNEEPVQTRDKVAMGQLQSIGIEKGKEFNPDAATRAILKKAAAEAHARFMKDVTKVVSYWPGSKWGSSTFSAPAAKTGFTFETENTLDLDSRATTFFFACAPPKKLGTASYYLTSAADAANASLNGSNTYRLRVPPNVPVKQFWAVTVYELETAAFFRNAPTVEVNSYQTMQKNSDGSVDIYFGPKAPVGKEANWIYTTPGKQWLSIFRFYGPEKAVFDKTWTLPDIEVAL